MKKQKVKRGRKPGSRKVMCFECQHEIKLHGRKGCSECACELTDLDYNQPKAQVERAILVTKLHGYLKQANLILQMLKGLANRLDEISTDELRETLSEFEVEIKKED